MSTSRRSGLKITCPGGTHGKHPSALEFDRDLSRRLAWCALAQVIEFSKVSMPCLSRADFEELVAKVLRSIILIRQTKEVLPLPRSLLLGRTLLLTFYSLLISRSNRFHELPSLYSLRSLHSHSLQRDVLLLVPFRDHSTTFSAD